MEKKIVCVLSLVALVLTFVAIKDFTQKAEPNVAIKQAKVVEPITLTIPEPSVIVVEEVVAKKVDHQPTKIYLKVAKNKKVRPSLAYDNKIDDAVIGMLEEGRSLSSTGRISETVAGEIIRETSNLKIQ